MQRHLMDLVDHEARNSAIEEAGGAIHRCIDTVLELVKKMAPVQDQQEAVARAESERDSTSSAREMVLELQRIPTQMGQFRKFFVHDPLKLLSEGKHWDSPVVYVGGSSGYRVGMRILMSGGGHAHGRAVTVIFRVFSGPYDDWLAWPFPVKSVTFAMFRRGGKPSHACKCSIAWKQNEPSRPTEGLPLTCAVAPHFIPIDTLLDDNNLVLKQRGLHDKDPIMLVGFALEGEELLCPQMTSSLETRLEHLENTILNGELARHRRRENSQLNRADVHDRYFCC